MFGWGKDDERRIEPRYYVSESEVLTVGVARQDSDWTLAELIDLSSCGAKFYLDTVLQFSERISFGLILPAYDIEMSMNATIAWSRATSDGRWMLGCSFASEIPGAVLGGLARAGLINRRKHARNPASLEAIARSQLSTESEAVAIKDYSLGGFRIESSVSHQVNECVSVQLSPEASVFGVIKWKSENAAKFEYGCEFIRDTPDHGASKLIERFCNAPTQLQGCA